MAAFKINSKNEIETTDDVKKNIETLNAFLAYGGEEIEIKLNGKLYGAQNGRLLETLNFCLSILKTEDDYIRFKCSNGFDAQVYYSIFTDTDGEEIKELVLNLY